MKQQLLTVAAALFAIDGILLWIPGVSWGFRLTPIGLVLVALSLY